MTDDDLSDAEKWRAIDVPELRNFYRGVELEAARRARCKCDCGAIALFPASSLLDGKRVSCGCLSRERSANRVRVARPRAVRQSLDTAWHDAKASAERVLGPIRTRIRWAHD